LWTVAVECIVVCHLSKFKFSCTDIHAPRRKTLPHETTRILRHRRLRMCSTIILLEWVTAINVQSRLYPWAHLAFRPRHHAKLCAAELLGPRHARCCNQDGGVLTIPCKRARQSATLSCLLLLLRGCCRCTRRYLSLPRGRYEAFERWYSRPP
jgi:hypothetical protein